MSPAQLNPVVLTLQNSRNPRFFLKCSAFSQISDLFILLLKIHFYINALPLPEIYTKRNSLTSVDVGNISPVFTQITALLPQAMRISLLRVTFWRRPKLPEPTFTVVSEFACLWLVDLTQSIPCLPLIDPPT